MVIFVQIGSRGAFVGIVVVTGYMLWGMKAIPVRTRLLAAATIIAAVTTLGSTAFWDNMGTLLNPTEDYNWIGGSSAGRMEVWKRGMGYMMQNPLTGVGVGAFYTAEGLSDISRQRQALGIGFKWSAPHNSFVQVGAELGIPGLILFVLMLYYAFTTARSLGLNAVARRFLPKDTYALGDALAASIVGYAATAFFLSQAYSAYLYVLLALVIGLNESARREFQQTIRKAREVEVGGTSSRHGPARPVRPRAISGSSTGHEHSWPPPASVS